MNRGLTREQAASLLGVDVGADPEAVRRAFRTWARLAHPDLGGKPEHFQALHQARDVLLGADEDAPDGPSPRLTWAEVIHPPTPSSVLTWAAGAVLVLALALLPALLGGGESLGTLAISAGPAAVAAAGWAVIVVNRLLRPGADVGHRIIALTLMWLPLAAGQVTLAQVAGTSLVPVLPLLALPFVAAVAAVNPGAGLWQAPRRH